MNTCAILPVDKPAGWTSFDVLAKLRGALGTRRLGHAGTLDPMATGVLAVFIGNATAAADRQPDHDKTYEATIRLGLRTDTGDVTGTALETAPVTVGEAELKAVLPQFMGRQMQLRRCIQRSRSTASRCTRRPAKARRWSAPRAPSRFMRLPTWAARHRGLYHPSQLLQGHLHPRSGGGYRYSFGRARHIGGTAPHPRRGVQD